MSGLQSLPVDEMARRGSINDKDILGLRRVFYDDGIVSRSEAEMIFKLNDVCAAQHADWAHFFIEAITDYIVCQERPQGYLTAENAEWLIEHTSRDGKIKGKAELQLVVNVLDKARWAPVSLARFALEQVKDAVVTGTGALRLTTPGAPGRITEGEVDLLRRILYGFGGDGHVAITRDEANILFDIDEAVAEGDCNPAWTDLFVKAIANVMMSASGYSVPTREEALRQEVSLEHPEKQTSVLAFLLSMVRTNLASVRDAYQAQSDEDLALSRLEHQRIEIITHEAITEAEATWLAGKLGRDGWLSPSEMALISYLKHESPRIHPALTEAVDRLASAA